MTRERCFEVVDQAIFLAQLPSDKRPKLLSDNGRQFRAKKAREFFKELLNITQIFTSSHHPETNGKLERLFENAKYEVLYRNDYSSPTTTTTGFISLLDTELQERFTMA